MDGKAENKADPVAEGRAWPRWFMRLAAAAVGLVFLSASVMKAADMQLFFRQIKAYGIVTDPLFISLGAWGLVALECALGVGLLIFYRPRWIIPLTMLLILVFLGVTSYAWLTETTEECGCFGAWMKQTPGEEAFQNAVLFLALVPAWLGRSRGAVPRSRAKGWIFGAACLAGLLLPWPFGFTPWVVATPQADRDRIEIGAVEVSGVKAVDLSRGRHLLFLMGTDCAHCRDALPEIEMLSEDGDLPPVLGLCPNEEEERLHFIDAFQPLFPLGRISEEAFFRLLGSGDTPRFILVENGMVREIWDQVVPTREALEAALAS